MNAIEKLAAAFFAAKKAAEQAKAVNSNDGGTCNLDSPVLWRGRITTGMVDQAAITAGIQVRHGKWLGKQCVFLSVMDGQGALRTRMAEAATNALRTAGLDACTFYMMD